MRGNLFASYENRFQFASKEELTEIARESMIRIVQALPDSFSAEMMFGFHLIAVQLGVFGDRVINKQEKELIAAVFKNYWKGPMEDLYCLIERPISENEYKLVSMLPSLGNDVAMPFLDLVLSFAYIDGVLEDEVAERLESLLGVNLMFAFFESGLEEVPKPKIKLTGLEAEIVEWFASHDEPKPLAEIQAHFSSYTKAKVKAALDSLCDRGIMFGAQYPTDYCYSLEIPADEVFVPSNAKESKKKTARLDKVSLNRKASPEVRAVIKEIGVVDSALSIKGKKFVLSEVKEPVTLAEFIVENGGEVKKSVAKTTDYIIIGDKSRSETNKIEQVLELNETKGTNIRAMCESDFWTLASNPQTSEGNKTDNEAAVFQLAQKNEKAIKKLLKEARNECAAGSSLFSSAQIHLEEAENCGIDIYDDEYHEFCDLARTISYKVYSIYQQWVNALDKKCTPLITEGVSPKLVQEIADLIEKLNEDSVIDIKFFNASFSPSKDARRIQEKWQKKAKEFKKASTDASYVKKNNIDTKDLKKHKNYLSAKAMLAKAKTAKNYRAVAEKLSKQKTYLDSKTIYEYCLQKAEALEEYEKVQKACTKRKKDISDLKYDHNVLAEKISKAEDNIKFVSSTLELKRRTYESSKNEIETQFNNFISEAEAKIEQNLDLKDKLEKAKAKLNAELDSAFFLSFGKKNKLKEQIQSAESQIYAAKKAISQARIDKTTYEQQKEHQLTALDATIANLEEDLKKNEAILPEYQKKLESISNRLVNHEQKLQEEEQLCKELKAKANKISKM